MSLLLASIVLVSLSGARDKARIAVGFQFSSSVHHALGTYTVGIWDFDDSTANDTSGNDNNGTLANGPLFRCTEDDTPSGNGCALEFDGSTNYIAIANDNSLNFGTGNFTLSVWVKGNSSQQAYSRIFYKNVVFT